LNVEGDEEDAMLTGIIKGGIEFIDGLSGMKLTYSETGRPRDMLFDYCDQAYIMELDEDEFKAKYADEILLVAVKNYLDITWHDPTGDNKLFGIIARGKKYLNKAAGAELDYLAEDKPRELLFDYCRYVRSNALDEFAINYQHELLSLQIAQEVKDYAEASDI
jgi:hypothetical protein